jgi:hypothetical protein
MATTLIRNGATSGAMMSLTALRGSPTSFTPADYAGLADIADAVAAEVLVKNALLAVPMADADNAQIGQLIEAVTAGVLEQRQTLTSVTAADYADLAEQICAAAKIAVAKLV